jgi:hypothetical protein
MSQIITRNAHAQSHANSELPTTSPQNGHIASQTRGCGVAPTSLPSQRPISPSDPDRSPDEHEQGSPAAPGGEPNPPDGGSDGRPDENDGTDGDKQDRDEGNDGGPRGEPDNMSVRDLLCLLGPILAVRRDPPPTIAPNAR